MIFVCGGAHSGTTLMATVLGAHSKTRLIPMETSHYLPWSLEGRLFDYLSDDNEFLVEKTPRHVYHLNQITDDFPEAKIVVVFRNPLDVAASLKARWPKWNTIVKEVAGDLQACIDADKKYDVLLVSYENLIMDFEGQMRRVCDYLGLDYEENMINFHESAPDWFAGEDNVKDPTLTIRNNQVHSPLYDGRGRWRNDLNNIEMKQIVRYCMARYEYLYRRA